MIEQKDNPGELFAVWILLALVFIFLVFVSSLHGIMARPQAKKTDNQKPRHIESGWNILAVNQEGKLLIWRKIRVSGPPPVTRKRLRDSKIIMGPDSVCRFEPIAVPAWHYEYIVRYCDQKFTGPILFKAAQKYVLWYNSTQIQVQNNPPK